MIGAGSLRFEHVRRRTVLTRSEAASPLRLLNPKNTGNGAWVYAATYGGGLLGGDAIELDVDVCSGATALLATQASTKVYRSPVSGVGAVQRLRARASNDSLLVLLPDPVTAYAGSRYRQEQEIRLAESASLVLVDWFTAGRIASGERWQFDAYTNRLFVRRENALLLHDAMSLNLCAGGVAERMNRFNCVATVVVTGPAVRAAAARLLGVMSSVPLRHHADFLMAAAPLTGDDGVVIRLAGLSVDQVGGLIRQHLNFVPSLLGDDPWTCKW